MTSSKTSRHNVLWSSSTFGLFPQVLIGFLVRIAILALDDLCYHRQPPLTPCQYKLGNVYLALLPLGKDINFLLVYRQIFLSIGLFNLSYDPFDLSSDNSLLVLTPTCTTLSVQPITFVD